MNIFIMILISIFMAGYYMISSPSQKLKEQETEYAVRQADLRSIAECAVAVHNASIKGFEIQDICIQQNEIQSEMICLNSSMRETRCEIVRGRKPDYTYLITVTKPIPDSSFSDMFDILEKYYYDAGNFGIFLDGKIMSNDTGSRVSLPDSIISALKLQNGQMIYITNYELPDETEAFSAPIEENIVCPAGTIKTYRFSRWQCLPYNEKTDCGGDMIWDSDLMECVPDESRKPLCAGQQTAVIVEDVWECINPFPDKNCPDGMIARLNYTTLEWECVVNPDEVEEVKKCDNVVSGAIYGPVGSTVRLPSTSCTDCEKMITDPETCVSFCVPDPSKLNNPSCYAGNTSDCRGDSKAFYFGFPSYSYAAQAEEQVEELEGKQITLDRKHSQNRKFNCMDCGEGRINTSKSFPPYIAICE